MLHATETREHHSTLKPGDYPNVDGETASPAPLLPMFPLANRACTESEHASLAESFRIHPTAAIEPIKEQHEGVRQEDLHLGNGFSFAHHQLDMGSAVTFSPGNIKDKIDRHNIPKAPGRITRRAITFTFPCEPDTLLPGSS